MRWFSRRTDGGDTTGCEDAEDALKRATRRHRAAERREGEIMETVENLRRVDRVNNFATAIRIAMTPEAPQSSGGT